MFRNIARGLLLAIALLLILFGATMLALYGAGQGAIVMGLALLVGVLFERWRYKPLERGPAAGFQPTPERFVDPGSGRPVRVYTDPVSGERRYVEDAGP